MTFFMSLIMTLSFLQTSEAQIKFNTYSEYQVEHPVTNQITTVTDNVTFFILNDSQANYSNITISGNTIQDSVGQRTEFREVKPDNPANGVQIYTANYQSINDNTYYNIYIDRDRNNIQIVNMDTKVKINFNQ